MQHPARIPSPALLAGLLFIGQVVGAQPPEERKVEVRTVRVPHVRVMELEGGPGRHAVFIGDADGRGYLGVELLPLTEELRRHFGVAEDRGVMISRIADDSPAAAAGLEAADIVISADGESVDSPATLSRLVRHKEPGEELSLEVFRDGRVESFAIAVGEREHVFRWHGEDLTAPEPEVWERLHEYLDGDEWRQRMERFESLDWKGIEERMREVEERLRQLERQLEESNP